MKNLIGVVTLESLGSNRTSLRIPSRSLWGKDLLGDAVIRAGLLLLEHNLSDRRYYDDCFRKYLLGLDKQLDKYSLKSTRSKRLGQWIKSHLSLSIIIGILAIIISLVGTNWSVVEDNLKKIFP